MGLQFVLGDLSVNKKHTLIRDMLQIKQHNPKARLFYLVPEHLKFDMETLLLNTIQQVSTQQDAASLDIQVVSFSRIAWFLMPNTLTQKTPITSIGIGMLIRQILQDNQDKLVVYKGQVQYQSFVDQLATLFNEFYQGQLLPEDIVLHLDDLNEDLSFDSNNAASVAMNTMEKKRLEELSRLYAAFIDAMSQFSLEAFDQYSALTDYLTHQPPSTFQDYYLYIDHHYYFNAQQLSTVLAFIRTFNTVSLTLPVSKSELLSQEWLPLAELPKHTYQQLREMCQLLTFPILPDKQLDAPLFEYGHNILTIAHAFKDNQRLNSSPLSETLSTQKAHHFWQCDTVQSELRHVSNEIHALVSQKGYRYRDILVVARHLDTYLPLVEPFFKLNDIPYFFDHATKMAQHPFVIWLESVFDLHRYRWQYRDIMKVLKSDLFIPHTLHETNDHNALDEFHHQIHWLENIILANGYTGFRFYDLNYQWQFDSSDVPYVTVKGETTPHTLGDIVNRLRVWFVEHLKDTFAVWKKPLNGEDAVRWLFELVNTTGVYQTMVNNRNQAIETGQLDLSRKQEQVWQLFVNALDEFQRLYKQATLNFDTFSEILLSGLMEGTYHIIPPTMDQITFTNMESPQVAPFKICFILGANQHQLPIQSEVKSLLTHTNREQIKSTLLPHQFLNVSMTYQPQQELLLAYQLLLNATDKVYISFTSNTDGKQTQLSPYFSQLMTQFHFKITPLSSDFTMGQAHHHLSKTVFGKYDMQISPILQMIRQSFELELPLTKTILEIVTFVLTTHKQKGKQLWHLIEQSFQFNQLPQNIHPETALALFGRNLNASVSKIEQYFQDPYSHFLVYGLKLAERDVFELSSAKTGDYFHEFLDQYMMQAEQQLPRTMRAFAQMSEQALHDLFDRIQQNMAQNTRYNVFQSNARMSFIQTQLNQRLWQFLKVSQKQHQLSQMSTIETEALFGFNQAHTFKGLDIPLQSGGQLHLRGKIDRIDALGVSTQPKYLQVVDYKSGNKVFNPVNLFYGLDLQIMTYLTVALSHYPKAKPVGAFYQPLSLKYQTLDAKLASKLESPESLNILQLDNQKYKGFVTLDGQELIQIEPEIEHTQQSQLYSVRMKKDGHYYNQVVYYDATQFETIQRYLLALYEEAGNQIQSGQIALNPYKEEPYTPSLQKQYRVITGFDATENYQSYRFKTVKKSEIINKMTEFIEERRQSE